MRAPRALLALLSASALVACEEIPPPVAPPVVAAPPTAATVAPGPSSRLAGVDEKAVDAGVSPCTDFYQYACGGWLKATPIPPEESSWTRSFDVLQETNEKVLREILERYARGEGKDEPGAQKLGDYFTACMDEPAIEKAGKKGLEPALARLDALGSAKDLAPLIAELHARNVRVAFSFDSGQDFKDATQVIGVVAQGGLGLPDRDYYLKDEPRMRDIREKYQAHVAAMLQLVGEKPADAAAHAAIVISVETALASAAMDKVDLRDPQKVYHRLDRAGLSKLAPSFDWRAYFEKLGLPEVTAINVAQPDFIKAVDEAVQHAPAAPCKPGAKCPAPARRFPAAQWRAYLRWHLVRAAAPSLSAAFVDEAFRFERVLTGAEQLPPRWKRCVRSADDALGEALARPFVAKMLGDEGKEAVKRMVAAIESSMSQNLAGLAWMDAGTRARAAEKLGQIANKIGYPDRWRSYEGLTIERGAYLEDRARASAFEVHRQLAKIGRPLDRGEWEMTPPTVNAYYEATLNEMVFPAGILEAPFFARDASLARNYGGIGMVLGHELTHGFDDEGRQFDGKGNLRDWWAPEVGAEFERRAACVVKQFDGYAAAPDLHLNGKLTLGENLADLGGLKLAYAAFAGELAAHPEARAAATFSDEQQFFLGFAQAWCTNQREESERLQVQTNPHSLPRFRVNGPASNMPEFARAFSCAKDTPMARADRCEVW